MPPFRDLLKEMDYSVPQEIEIIQGSERGKNVSDEKQVSVPEEKDKKEDLLAPQNGEEDERKRNTVPFHKLFQFASPLDIIYMIIGTIGAIVDGMSLPFMAIMLGELLDSYGNNTGDLNKLLHEVARVALNMFYLGLGAAVASFCEVTLWMCSGERQAARIRQLYLKAILRQDVAYFDKGTSTGEVVERMCGDTSLVQEAIGEKVAKFIRLLSVFLSGFVIAFFRGWLLTLVMLSTIPPVVVCGAIMGMVIAKATDAGQKSYGDAASLVEQVVSGIRTVASFTGEKKAVEQYDHALKKAYKSNLYQGLASGLALGIMFLIFFAGYALALWYGSKLIMNNHGYTGGKVINIIIVVLLGSMSLGQSSPCLAAFSAGQAAAYNIFAVIHRVPPIDIYDSKGLTIENFKGSIELQNVDFAYPARPDVPVFKQFCLEIPSGVTAALVGESGSGKSTVIRLINRFYDPQSGEVMLDGINIKKLQLKWTRQQIGLVSQEPILFNMSIKENIAYGNENATLDEIKAAASLANAANFIHVLPQGYDTEVGQSGSKISGGQKQRIAIARAILKNPKILLLDEATSALDTASERLVQEALDRIMANHTTVVVAHRLSTIKNANLIAVVQNGTVVEKGTHNELLKNTHGAYSQLARLQEMHKGKKIRFDPNVKEQEPTILRERSRSSPPDSRQQAEPSKTKEDIEAAVPKETSIFRLASLNKPEIPVALLGSLAAITNGIIFPVYGLLLSSMIATFYQTNHHKLQKDADFWAMMFIFLGLVMLVAAPLQSYCFAIVGSKLVRRIRKMVFANVVRQEISWFDNSANSSGAISARLSTDAISVRTMVGDSLSLLVQNIATAVAGLLIAFTASWQLSLIFISMGPLMSVQGLVQVKMVTGFSGDSKIKYEEATQIATDAVSNIRTVASFCAEEKVLKLYERRSDIPLRNGLRTAIVSGVGMAISTIIQFGSQSLIFWYGAQMVHDGKTTFKAVLKVFFAIMLSAFSISQTIGMTPDVSKAKASINSIFAMLDKKSSIDSTNNAVGKVLDTVKGDIDIQHVNFRYPTRPDVQIFQDLSLFVQAGKNIALVGESGSGKSTIIALIERFYDPNSGQIFLDGVDIKELKLRWLRQQIGLVSQEPILFSGTIKSNIAYGKEGLLTDDEIYSAAEIANANNFIMMLPNGYETEVGERGIQLSGGQKQRIAIARAIIKNPKVLLLDEATSALDAESERVVQDALERIMVGRSTIIVAHRLSTILNANMIIVLKNGVVVEKGTHSDLVRIDGGTYSSLVKLHY